MHTILPHLPFPEQLRGKSKEELMEPFTESEREKILQVPSASNSEDLRLFCRLAPYFSNGYHLEV